MRKQIQFINLYLNAFLEKHKKQILISGIIGFFITLFLIQTYPLLKQFSGNKQLRIGIVGKFNEITLPLKIQKLISLGLTSVSENGNAQPSIATSWDVNDKNVEWIFHLQKDIYWHDGKKFSSGDINFHLSGATFSKIDDSTIKVSLKESYVPLPVVLSQPILKPNLMGLGLYKVIRLLRRGDDISEMTLEPRLKYLPSRTYKFYPNLDEAVLAFKLGEIDLLEDIINLGDLANWKNIKITPNTEFDKYVGLFFNLRNPLFKEKEVRQALSYAIPKTFEQEKASTPISPLSWAYSLKNRLYSYDSDVATKILSKSPLSSSSSKITISTYASLIDSAQYISDAWKKVGVNSKIRIESSLPSDYEVLLITQVIPSDPDQYQYWQSTQEGTNLTHYNNPKIDKLLEDGRKTLDQNTRKKIYADFQRYIVDDAPVIFLYYPVSYSVERK